MGRFICFVAWTLRWKEASMESRKGEGPMSWEGVSGGTDRKRMGTLTSWLTEMISAATGPSGLFASGSKREEPEVTA